MIEYHFRSDTGPVHVTAINKAYRHWRELIGDREAVLVLGCDPERDVRAWAFLNRVEIRVCRDAPPGMVYLLSRELADMLGVSEGAVRARAARLAEDRLVERTHTSGFAFYSITTFGKRALR